MYQDVRDFVDEEFQYDDVSGLMLDLGENFLRSIGCVIACFPCKDFSRLNTEQTSNRNNVHLKSGTSGSVFAGVTAFLSKWLGASKPTNPSFPNADDLFKGRILMGMLENVESMGDPKTDDEIDGCDSDEELGSALSDCIRELEELGFCVIDYLMHSRDWGLPQSRRRWCPVLSCLDLY